MHEAQSALHTGLGRVALPAFRRALESRAGRTGRDGLPLLPPMMWRSPVSMEDLPMRGGVISRNPRQAQDDALVHARVGSPSGSNLPMRPGDPRLWLKVASENPRNNPQTVCSERHTGEKNQGLSSVGEWRSLVARLLWEQDVAGSNPVSPTICNYRSAALAASSPYA